MKLLLSKTFVETANTPVFFLGGPIRGAGDWQAKAIEFIDSKVPEALIVCPSRYPPTHYLYQYKQSGVEDRFESQTEWERFYLEKASKNGCVMFWIPKQDALNPRPAAEGPYGQDSYGELGEWRAHLMYNPDLHFVVGAEEGSMFGLEQIKKNYRYALNGRVTFLNTLDEVLKQGLEKAGY